MTTQRAPGPGRARADPPWRRLSLAGRLTLGLMLISVVLAALGAGGVTQLLTARARADSQAQGAALAQHAARLLDRSMAGHYREVVGLSAYADLPGRTPAEVRAMLERVQRGEPRYAWIGYADAAGRVVAATGGLLTGVNVSARPWFRGGRRGPVAGDVHEALPLSRLLPRGDVPRFVDFAAPVRGRGGQLVGVLGAHLSWAWMRDFEAEVARLAPGVDTQVLIVDRRGAVLYGPQDEIGKPLQGLAAAGRGERGAAYGPGPAGAVLSGYAPTLGDGPYPGFGWRVLVRQDEAAVLAPVRALVRSMLAWTAASLALLALLAFVAVRRAAGPLERLSAAASGVRGLRADELPLLRQYPEVETLSRTLRTLVGELGSVHQGLEARVSQRTAQLETERERAEVLARLTEALQGAHTPGEVAQLAVARLGPAVRATGMLLLRLDGENLSVLAAWGEVPAFARQRLGDGPAPLAAVPLLREVARSREAVYLDDLRAMPGARADLSALAGAAEPILAQGGEVVGFVLACRPVAHGPWRAGQRELLSRAAAALGLSLERARAARALERAHGEVSAERRRAELLAALGDSLLESGGDMGAATPRALELIASGVSADLAVVGRYEGERVRFLGHHGEALGPLRLALAQGAAPLAGLNAALRATQEAIYTLGGTPEASVSLSPAQSVGMEPVSGPGGELLGFLAVGRRPGLGPWSTPEQAFLRRSAQTVGRAIQQAEVLGALRERTEQLWRSNVELERFAYVASHDLQEPLRTVVSFSDLLRRELGDGLSPRAARSVDTVRAGAERMQHLVQDLLAYSRVQGGAPPLRPTPLAEPLTEALARLDAALRESGGRVHAGPLPVVQGDGPRLAQVFQNLVGNALKFARAAAPPEVQVTARRDGDLWLVSVADNGIGIESAYFERVFELFQRLNPRERYGGSGVGLAICRKIVEAHGGHIWVQSVPGEGSTFTFSLRA